MNEKWEEIVVLGGEGGSVKLLGKKTEENRWVFMKATNETIMLDFFDEEDLGSIEIQKTKEVHEWSKAIKLLGSKWYKLVPRYIHPEFRETILKEICSIDEANSVRRWERVCRSNY